MIRASVLANAAPQGPVYVNLDAEMQEAPLAAPLPPIDAQRYMPPVAVGAPADAITQAADLLRAAKRPVILVGRNSRSMDAWNALVSRVCGKKP